MKNAILFIIFIISFVFASGGDTIKFTTAVKSLSNGDRFYADIHWKSLQDSIARVVNGRQGNVNLASDANIDPSKFDSTKTIVMRNGRIDTIVIKNGTLDTVIIRSGQINVLDSTYAPKGIKIERGTIDTIRGDTISATAAKINRIDTLFIQTGIKAPRIDSTYFPNGVFNRRSRSDTIANKFISSDTATVTGATIARIDSLYSPKGLNVPRIDSAAFTKGVYQQRARSDTISNKYLVTDTITTRSISATNGSSPTFTINNKLWSDTLFSTKKSGFFLMDSSDPQIYLKNRGAVSYYSGFRPYCKTSAGDELAFAYQISNEYNGGYDLGGMYVYTDGNYRNGMIKFATIQNNVGHIGLRINSLGQVGFGNYDASYQLDCRNVASIDSLDADTLYSDAGYIPRLKTDSVTNKFISGDTAYYRASKTNYLNSTKIVSDSLVATTGLRIGSSTIRIGADSIYSLSANNQRLRADSVRNKNLTSDSIYSLANKSQRSKIDSLSLGFGNAKICTYAETTWTDTAVGFSGTVNVTVTATKIGNVVTLNVGSFNGTSNSDVCYLGHAIPSKLNPIQYCMSSTMIINSSIVETGHVSIETFSIKRVVFRRNGTMTGFDISGTKGVFYNSCITYIADTNTW